MTRGQFKPGKSGNAGGRPKGQADAARKVALMIQAETGDGVELVQFALAILRVNSDPPVGRPTTEESARRKTLAEWGIEAKDVTLLDRRWAMEWLSDRGLGKAMAFIDVTTDGGDDETIVPLDLSGLTLDQLKDLRRRLRPAAPAEDGAPAPPCEPEPAAGG